MNLILDKLKQYPLAVASGVLLVLFVGVLFLRGDVVAELSAQEAELVARIRTIDGNIKNSKDLEQEVEALEAHVVSIDERLFNRQERAINTNFFYSFEDKIDILISSVSQLAVEDPALSKDGPNELKLHSAILYDITVKGTFKEILGFIYEIHRVDPLIRVSDFQIDSTGSKDAKRGDLVAKLRVLVLARQN
jgi:hypothetical protein